MKYLQALLNVAILAVALAVTVVAFVTIHWAIALLVGVVSIIVAGMIIVKIDP